MRQHAQTLLRGVARTTCLLLGVVRSALPVLAVTGVFVACAGLMFQDSLLRNAVFWEADTVMFYYPIAQRIDHVLTAGHLPLWTPYIFGGHPLLADGEAGMLYPINLLAWWLLSDQDAFIALRIIRFALAGLFTYGFLRALRQSRAASLLGGLVFAYGSFMVGQLHHANVSANIIWLPFILRHTELALQQEGRRRWLSVLVAGAGLGLSILTIHINPFLMTLLVVGSYVAFRVLLGPVAGQATPWPTRQGRLLPGPLRRRLVQGARRLAGSAALGATILAILGMVGLGLGAVQLLPLWELAQFSSRYAGVDYRFATSFSLPPANLLTLVFPYFFRDAQSLYWSPWFRWDTIVYVGLAPLLLAVLGALAVRTRTTLYFVVLAILGLLLAMGDYLPVKPYGFLWKLPVFSMTRVPARFTLFTVLGCAVLAGQGFDYLRHALRPRRRLGAALRLAGWRMAAGLHTLLQGRHDWRGLLAATVVALRGRLAAALRSCARLLARVWRWPALARRARSAAQWWMGGKRSIATLVLVGSVLSAAAGLALSLEQAHTWVQAHPDDTKIMLDRFYPRDRQNPLVDRPSPDAAAGLAFSLSASPWTRRSLVLLLLFGVLLALWYRLRLLAPLWSVCLLLLVAADLLLFARDYHPRLKRDDLSPRSAILTYLRDNRSLSRVLVAWPISFIGPNRLLPYQIPEASGYSSLITQRYQAYTAAMQRSPARFLDLLSVRYIVVAKESARDQLAGSTMLIDEGYMSLHERHSFQPRAFLVADATVADSAPEVLQMMAQPNFDARRLVVLETPPPATTGAQDASIQEMTAAVVDDTPERVVVRTRSPRQAYLILADTYYPGWQARIDGMDACIYRADYLFRAVVVPAGEHTVEFVYRPLSVAVGALLTAFTTAVMACACLGLPAVCGSGPSCSAEGGLALLPWLRQHAQRRRAVT